MPHYIVKPVPDRDFYYDWSTIVDAPCYWGTRAELEACEWVETFVDRFDRADRTGTSSLDGFEGWEDTEILIHEIGGGHPFIVDRVNMEAFCKSLDLYDTDVYDASLTRPWEPEEIRALGEAR